MALILLATIPPYHQVAVNPQEVLAIQPDLATPDDDTELVAEGGRTIRVIQPLLAVAPQLGGDFRGFDAAAVQPHRVFINKAQVLHVLPHPQVPQVCFVHCKDRRFAVKGDLPQVVARLA